MSTQECRILDGRMEKKVIVLRNRREGEGKGERNWDGLAAGRGVGGWGEELEERREFDPRFALV